MTVPKQMPPAIRRKPFYDSRPRLVMKQTACGKHSNGINNHYCNPHYVRQTNSLNPFLHFVFPNFKIPYRKLLIEKIAANNIENRNRTMGDYLSYCYPY